MTPRPVDLKITEEDRLRIEWNDGLVREYAYGDLRNSCPCATCRDNRTKAAASPAALPVLSPAEAQPLRILGMKPVGNYAYSIHFSDGHNTGIYQFELLRELGTEV